MFSRSELRAQVLAESIIPGYRDTNRPRVTKWSRCALCQNPFPTYTAEVDHKDPVIPLDRSMEDMTLDEVAMRIWCERQNLQVVCEPCHKIKSKAENKTRRARNKSKAA